MKQHLLSGLVMILVMVAYFTWRFSMLNLDPVFYWLLIVFSFSVGLAYIIHYREPKDEGKRKQAIAIFLVIVIMFLMAFLIRIIFLS